MNGIKIQRAVVIGLAGATVLVAGLLVTPSSASFTLPGDINWYTMTVEEILYKPDHSDLTFDPAGTVRMDINGGFLYIELMNTSTGNTTNTDSGNVLCGLGFTLPTGVALAGDMTSNDVDFGSGSTLVPAGTWDPLTNQRWGLGNASSHFSDPALLAYQMVVSTFNSDVQTTLTGVGGDMNAAVDQMDYGLVSANAGLGNNPQRPYVEDQLVFKLKLDTELKRDQILEEIEEAAVGLAFDSPTRSDLEPPTGIVPEPSTLIIWSLLGGLGIAVGWWRRRKSA